MTPSKYWAAAKIAMAQASVARSVLVGRIVLFAIFVTLYARIWQLVGEHGTLGEFGRTDLIWYLTITEWLALSLPPLHLDIEADVRNGNLAYLLPRPVSYLWLRFAEALGTLLVRMLGLGVFGFGMALYLGGGLPSGGLLALVCGALTAVVAATLNLVFSAIIGLSAFFVEDASPAYWVWQKLSFVFGGLMFPLDIYPDAMQKIAHATPFPSLLYAPGRIAIGASPAFASESGLRLALWLGLAIVTANYAYRRALRALELNGG